MSQVRVAIVCPDDSLRMVAAQAFDHAPPDWDVSLHREVPAASDAVVSVGCHLPDAIPFDPTRAQDVVEAVEQRLAKPRHRVITVVGASGGCGATSLALHLAAAATGDRCLLVARDPRPLAYRLGLEPALLGVDPIPVPGGFKVAEPGALAALAGRFDAVVIDAGRVDLCEPANSSDACVLVLNPTVPSARAAGEVLAAHSDRAWAVVTNRLGPGGETTTAQLQRILGCRLCMELPCSRGLRDAESEMRLLTGWSPWRQRVARLAGALGLT